MGTKTKIPLLYSPSQYHRQIFLNIRLRACSTFVFSVSNKFKKSADNVLPALLQYHTYYFTSSNETFIDLQLLA